MADLSKLKNQKYAYLNQLSTEKLEELYGDCDVEVNYGGQPIYYYVISVE